MKMQGIALHTNARDKLNSEWKSRRRKKLDRTDRRESQPGETEMGSLIRKLRKLGRNTRGQSLDTRLGA
jgi:hypothetical protein